MDLTKNINNNNNIYVILKMFCWQISCKEMNGYCFVGISIRNKTGTDCELVQARLPIKIFTMALLN